MIVMIVWSLINYVLYVREDILFSQNAWDTSNDPFESSLYLNSVKDAPIVGPGVDFKGKSYVSLSYSK